MEAVAGNSASINGDFMKPLIDGNWAAHIPGRLVKAGGRIEWKRIGRCWIATLNGSPFATVRRADYQSVWVAHIPGFQWDLSDAQPGTVSHALKIQKSEYRGFSSSSLARRAVERAYSIISYR